MEAKVDIKKLQLLNDRINLALDALNQVRMSVHGLSHTAAINPMIGVAPTAVGIPTPYPLQPQVSPQFVPGVQHTSVGQFPSYFTPSQFPTAVGFGTGIAHTSPDIYEQQRFLEARMSDPYRLARTFPYAFTPYSPTISW